MTTPRHERLEAIAQLSVNDPEMRLGQLMITIANWATRQPDRMRDVTDEELLAAITAHLERTGSLPATT